jgi:manganese/zinc/iron transport system substrate-binding protein
MSRICTRLLSLGAVGLIGVGAVLATGSAAAAAAPAAPLRAVTTIGMIADVARNVAGPCAEIGSLMGSGVDPHLYRASAGDVRRLQEADVIFYSGYVLEGQMGEVLGKFAQRKPTVAVSPAAISPDELITVQDVYGIDPHLWMDVSLWARIAPVIADTLGGIAPACAAGSGQRAAAYQAQLGALHGWIKESVATIPEGQRIVVTAHDAFNYYGRAYGLRVAGIQGISTEAEAGVADVRATVDLVVQQKIPAIFVESTINPRTIQAVIDGARQRGQTVEIGGALYSDAMGEAGTPGGTYIGMLYENTRKIVEALGGRLVPLPEQLHDWAKSYQIKVAAQ